MKRISIHKRPAPVCANCGKVAGYYVSFTDLECPGAFVQTSDKGAVPVKGYHLPTSHKWSCYFCLMAVVASLDIKEDVQQEDIQQEDSSSDEQKG
jgi:hypothetical protein